MANIDGIANLAAGLERLAKRVREGDLPWDTATRGALVAAVDDLKILIRGVRTWGAAEEARASDRLAEIDRLAPKADGWRGRGGGSAFLASATFEAAAALLEYADHPSSAPFAKAMEQVRALRGVAALSDLPPLGEVVDTVDATAKAIEMGQDATAERRRLFRTAAKVLMEGGDAVRGRGVPPVDSPLVREFALAAATLSAAADGDEVVPIAALLAEGPDAVQAAPNPPTTAAQRFRLEVVSQAEHLRRLVGDGRGASDMATRDRVARELRGIVRALARGAQSFGSVEIANLFLAAERSAAALEPATLDVLDSAARLLSASDAAPESITRQFITLGESLAGVSRRASAPVSAVPIPAPVARAAGGGVAVPRAEAGGPAPSGAALRDLLAVGLVGLAPLGDTRLATPLVGEEDDVIPVEDLLYRGKSALDRALHLGDALRRAGTVPDPATLDELYDLLQLAAAE